MQQTKGTTTRPTAYFPAPDEMPDCSQCERPGCTGRGKPQRGNRALSFDQGRCPRLPDRQGRIHYADELVWNRSARWRITWMDDKGVRYYVGEKYDQDENRFYYKAHRATAISDPRPCHFQATPWRESRFQAQHDLDALAKARGWKNAGHP